jgi:hypothetical protein
MRRCHRRDRRAASGRRQGLRTAPSRLMFKQAIMNCAPVWQADRPEVKFVCGARGKPKSFVRRMITGPASETPFEVETDGGYEKAHRPYGDVYRKQYLDPDPVDAGVARGEYEIWIAALGVLVEELAGKLEAHEALRSARPWRPWESGVVEGRVLPDLSQKSAPREKLPVRRKRTVAAVDVDKFE